MSRRWIVPLAALALLVPVGAVALDRGSSGLAVAASLESCGVAGDSVVCQVSASFNHVEDAEFYTATITRPDSTVQDFGRIASGGAGRMNVSLWVSYASNGPYVVEITAWSQGPDGEPKEVAKGTDKPEAGGDEGEAGKKESKEPGSPGKEGPPTDEQGPQPDEAPADEAPALPPECDPGSGDSQAPAGAEPTSGDESTPAGDPGTTTGGQGEPDAGESGSAEGSGSTETTDGPAAADQGSAGTRSATPESPSSTGALAPEDC